MKKILIVLLFSLVHSFIFSQTEFYSLDTQIDARSISMGESFVALTNPSSGGYYNPATLSGIKGITSSFNKRFYNWLPAWDQMYFISWNAAVNTPIGAFGVFYDKFNLGDLIVSTEEFPGPDGKFNLYEHTYGIIYSTKINKNLQTGITLKTYNEVQKNLILPPEIMTHGNITQPYLLDVGLIYNHTGFVSSDYIFDDISFGTAIQNFGSDLKYYDNHIRLPRYFRIGLAYKFSVNNQNDYNLKNLQCTLTGEYCNHLNTWKTARSEKDYWKAGMEATFFKILSLRIGGYTQPQNNIYGLKGLPSFRYGFGFNIPAKLLGFDTPASLSFDYAAMPIEVPDYWYSLKPSKQKTLTAFSLELRYEEDLF
jgi:hypothetical protein